MTSDRKKRLQFHIDSRDYFSTLASIITFIVDSIEAEAQIMGRSVKEMTHSAAALRRINKDLLYLQANYHIENKAEITEENN